MDIRKPYLYLVIVFVCALLSSCTSVDVRKVDSGLHEIDHVCIENNPAVQVTDFISVLKEKFMDHGISSEVFYSYPPERCKYIVRYTAKRSWDFKPYLSYAELEILKDMQIIGSATYKHEGGSMSLASNKWASTKEKMDPVIDELLAEF